MHGYDPDTDQHEADWLAAEHDAGSVPEYGYGLRVGIGGKLLHEYSMIRSELPHRMRNDPPDRHVLTTASRDPSSNRRRPRGCGSPLSDGRRAAVADGRSAAVADGRPAAR